MSEPSDKRRRTVYVLRLLSFRGNIMKMKKILVFILILFTVSAGLFWGNKSIVTTEYTVSPENLPESFEGFRIVHISDLHNTDFGGKLIEKTAAAKPDIIVVTGDIVDSYSPDIPVAVEFAKKICEIAPVYYVTGNHESRFENYESIKAQLEDAGFEILDGKTAEITRNGEKIELIGIDDFNFFVGRDPFEQYQLYSEELKKLAAGANGETGILLSHKPEFFELYAECGFDIVFCGHAHGGQMRLPFVGGIYTPDQGFFPEYTEGVHQKGKTNMVISRGLGNSIFPLRIFNRPEIIVCNLGE